jgi:hypothetical protein
MRYRGRAVDIAAEIISDFTYKACWRKPKDGWPPMNTDERGLKRIFLSAFIGGSIMLFSAASTVGFSRPAWSLHSAGFVF